jgi:hypothetical protein
VITDPIKAREVLSQLEKLAGEGWAFKVLKFNPDTDRFEIFLGRESNFPPLPVVEQYGTTLDGPVAKVRWSAHSGAVEAVSFGNGLVGLFYESDGLGYMAIPSGKG